MNCLAARDAYPPEAPCGMKTAMAISGFPTGAKHTNQALFSRSMLVTCAVPVFAAMDS